MDWSPRTRTVQISADEFDRIKHLPLRLTGDAVGIGERFLSPHDALVCGDMGTVPVYALAGAAVRYHRLTRLGRTPQIAALLFDCTGDPRFLRQYFPLAKGMAEGQWQDLVALVGGIAAHRHLHFRLIAEGNLDRTADLARSARWIVAGYLVEALWARQDILAHVLSGRRNVRLYTSELAFEESSGLRMGEYHMGRHTIETTLAQIYTGFYTEVPGVAPLLHALGHLLDDCDGRTGAVGRANGALLGMSRRDGALWTADAHALFIEGKRLECERYERFRSGRARMGEPMPIGQPHLFHDDLEFAAGYFELFFRIPRYFDAQNHSLFEAYRTLLRQDPRHYWSRDCSLYVDQSRATYTAPFNLPPTGIRATRGWWPF